MVNWRGRYEARRAKKLCVYCKRKAKPGRIRCAYHARRTAMWVNGRYWQRVARGVCTQCGKVKVERYRVCTNCRRKESQ